LQRNKESERREAAGLNARATALWPFFSARAMLRLNATFQVQELDQLPLVRQRGVQVEQSKRQRRHTRTFVLPHQGSLDHDIQSIPQVRAANQRLPQQPIPVSLMEL